MDVGFVEDLILEQRGTINVRPPVSPWQDQLVRDSIREYGYLNLNQPVHSGLGNRSPRGTNERLISAEPLETGPIVICRQQVLFSSRADRTQALRYIDR